MDNKVDIQEVLGAVRELSPMPNLTKVTWEYPGYIHIAFPKDSKEDYYVALGKHLDEPQGYSWNDTEGDLCGEISDLESAEEIAKVFWLQVLEALKLS